jgi:4-amino-4-deoxy-L-arabinose transferase-like glycosyltransferase
VEHGHSRQLLIWLWAALPFLFFTLSTSKLPGYVLPIIPAMALLVAIEWDRYFEGDVLVRRAMPLALGCLAVLGVMISAGILVGFRLLYQAPVAGVLIAAPLLIAVLWAQVEYFKRKGLLVFTTLVGGMTVTLSLLYWQAAPLVGDFHSTRSLAYQARPYLSKDEPLVLYRYFHHSARYYADYLTTTDALSDPVELQDYLRKEGRERCLVLTQVGGWQELHCLIDATLLGRKGRFCLVRVDKPPEEWNLPQGGST